MPATFATATHTGLVRKSNEDSLFARPPVFVVADGMGGAQAGEVASGIAVGAFEGYVPQSKSPEDELKRVIAGVNVNIYELAASEASRSGMGTTLTAAVVRGGSVSIAHVGDSRAYLWRGGNLTQLTEDHSLVGEMVRSGQITSEEAEGHPQRSIITRALGVDPAVEIDTRTLEWKPGDLILLCSDGLYSMVDDEAIASVMARGDNLYVSAWTLVEAANAGGGRDNISVVLVSPDGSVESGLGADTAQTSAPVQGGAQAAGMASAHSVTPAPPEGFFARIKRWLASVPGRITIGLALVVLILSAAWFITRQVYYLGVEGDHVVIYRGVPYDLGPLSLSSLYRNSVITFSDMEPFEQDRVLKGELQSKSSAETMLDNYSTQARERKQEADRLAAEADARAKAASKNLVVPPGGLP